jgi:hypothetical protein
MDENVGTIDRTLRALIGSALITVSLTSMGALRGRIAGLVTLIAGVLTVESAITRVCPVNYLAGIDTAELEEELAGETQAVEHG